MYKKTIHKIYEYIENNDSKFENNFIKNIIKIKSITNKERIELVNRVKNNDKNANKELIYYSLKDILAIALNFCDDNYRLIDLVQEGSFHIIELAKSVDLNKYKFQNYLRFRLLRIFEYYKYSKTLEIKDKCLLDYKNKLIYKISENIFLKDDLQRLIEETCLTDMEKLILNLKFFGKLNDREISEIIGSIGSRRVNQIYIASINKLRCSTHTEELIHYMDNPSECHRKVLKYRKELNYLRKFRGMQSCTYNIE